MKEELNPAQKNKLEIIYSKSYNTCKLIAQYNQDYQKALIYFNLPLLNNVTNEYINKNQTLNYAHIAENLEKFKQALSNNKREDIEKYAEILCHQDKNLYFNSRNVYYNVRYELAKFEWKNQQYEKALQLFKEIEDSASFKKNGFTQGNEYARVEENLHVMLNISSAVNRFHIFI